jgi:dinuclear metal center YbgI/SA1388 family protein
VIAQAVGNGIALLALHTNLDAAAGGINDILAELLGLQNVDVLQPVDNTAGAGLGRIGDLRAAVPPEAFRKAASEALGIGNLALIGSEAAGEVRRVAVVGGSGGSLVATAREKGADLLLTGDIGHHHALEAAALGLILVDGGHFATEKAAFRVFGSKLGEAVAKRGWDVSIEVDEGEIDPKSSFKPNNR